MIKMEQNRINSVVTCGLKIITGFCFFVMLVLTFADVIARYLINAPIPGAAEILAFGMGFMVFAVYPLITRDQGHITVGIFERFYKSHFRYVQRLLVLFLTLVYTIFVTYVIFLRAEDMRKKDFLTDYLDLPKANIIYVIAFFSFLCIVMFLPVLWRYIRQGGDPESIKKSESPQKTDKA